MAENVFTIDGISFNHLRILSLTQTFEILDGDNSKRTLSGTMVRDVIGTYYNYKLKIKPEYSKEGMQEYNYLWYLCSRPKEYHTVIIPDDVSTNTTSSGTTHSSTTWKAYITSGSRDMLKYNVDGIDYWKEGEFQFVSMNPAVLP